MTWLKEAWAEGQRSEGLLTWPGLLCTATTFPQLINPCLHCPIRPDRKSTTLRLQADSVGRRNSRLHQQHRNNSCSMGCSTGWTGKGCSKAGCEVIGSDMVEGGMGRGSDPPPYSMMHVCGGENGDRGMRGWESKGGKLFTRLARPLASTSTPPAWPLASTRKPRKTPHHSTARRAARLALG